MPLAVTPDLPPSRLPPSSAFPSPKPGAHSAGHAGTLEAARRHHLVSVKTLVGVMHSSLASAKNLADGERERERKRECALRRWWRTGNALCAGETFLLLPPFSLSCEREKQMGPEQCSRKDVCATVCHRPSFHQSVWTGSVCVTACRLHACNFFYSSLILCLPLFCVCCSFYFTSILLVLAGVIT